MYPSIPAPPPLHVSICLKCPTSPVAPLTRCGRSARARRRCRRPGPRPCSTPSGPAPTAPQSPPPGPPATHPHATPSRPAANMAPPEPCSEAPFGSPSCQQHVYAAVWRLQSRALKRHAGSPSCQKHVYARCPHGAPRASLPYPSEELCKCLKLGKRLKLCKRLLSCRSYTSALIGRMGAQEAPHESPGEREPRSQPPANQSLGVPYHGDSVASRVPYLSSRTREPRSQPRAHQHLLAKEWLAESAASHSFITHEGAEESAASPPALARARPPSWPRRPAEAKRQRFASVHSPCSCASP